MDQKFIDLDGIVIPYENITKMTALEGDGFSIELDDTEFEILEETYKRIYKKLKVL